ncbi:sporulation protein YqfD [Acetonema longum]|uniref:Putative stage IV sporulation YqfD n=1 Tax=Acetonema longum DSM 6540 TaxID=1009370 RepID=F7NKX6_9FIRM|nr:sporulation protein YqfD [Acetonema longum]EGO63319.1 putative stage IV sporulation YqfD [Acetonema longum DSM 6540]
MLLHKLRMYANGSVRIEIVGRMPERFINLCMAQEIYLWGIIETENKLYAYVLLPDFFRIRPLVKKSQCRIRVLGYRGLPFLMKRIKRRKMMVVGFVLFLTVLQILTSYIWFIDITGVKTVSREALQNVLTTNGLRIGAVKHHIQVKAVENAIETSIPEVAWVGLTFQGTRAMIEIVEKTTAKEEDKSPADIVALRDGIVTEAIVLTGEPMVKKGDTVRKGDVLIRGMTEQQPVRAKGIIKARTWYESYSEAGFVEEKRERTGRRLVSVILHCGDREIIFNKIADQPFALYETEFIRKKAPQWRNSSLAVECTIKLYHELTATVITYTQEQVQDHAKAEALAVINQTLPESAEILTRTVTVLQTPETDLIRVKVTMEAMEDIGVTSKAPL